MDELNQEEQDFTPVGDQATPQEAQDTVPKKEFDKVFARAKQAEEAEKRLKEELASLKTQKPAPSEDLASVKEELALLKFMQKGYSEDEAKLLRITGDDPVVIAGIEAMRKKAKAEQGTPPPSTNVALEPPLPEGMPGKDKPFDRRAFLQKKTAEALDIAKAKGKLRYE